MLNLLKEILYAIYNIYNNIKEKKFSIYVIMFMDSIPDVILKTLKEVDGKWF